MWSSSPDARDVRTGNQFLAATILGAVNSANAQKPISRTGRLSVVSFFPGWLTSELPLHAIGWQALATVAFARKGAFRTWRGVVGLAICAFSWSTLARVWKQSTLAGEVYERALEEGLGDDLVHGEMPESAGQPALERRRIAAGPLTRWRQRYVRDGNISYGDAGRRNELDIWARADLPADGKAPVLVQVHGGAWVIGNKGQQAMPLMAHMADQGWICVAINYRLSPRATWPDHIVDVKRALAWVKANIASYGGDPEYVAITGGSAGGHLASLAALTPNEPQFQPGFEDADTSVVAAVPFYGVYDWTNRDGTGRGDMDEMLTRLILKTSKADSPKVWNDASTMSWVNEDAPPFFVIHGSNDALVPVEQARSFVAMMRATSRQPVVFCELPGAQHAFEVFDSPRTIFTAGAVHRFLESIRQRDGAVPGAPAAASAERDQLEG